MTSDSVLSVQTVDSKGNAPKRRIASAAAAMTAYNLMREGDRLRDIRFGHIAGINNMFPPVAPSDMEKQGMGDMPNLNTGEFPAGVRDYAGTWHAINCSTLEWAKVEAEHDDPMEAERRSKYLTECFNWCLQKWDRTGFSNGSDYLIESAIRDTQMALFSIGIGLWRDHIDWRWKAIPTRKVLFPEGTNLLLDNCPAMCVEDEISVSELYSKKDLAGWNKDAVLWLLYFNQGARSANTGQMWTFAEWVERIRENDTYLITDFTPIPYVHVYAREFGENGTPGKISHVCISPSLWQSADQKTGEIKDKKEHKLGEYGFLYDQPESDHVEHWNQVVSLFCDDVGAEGKYHGARGFGDRNYDLCHFNNLMFSEVARAAIRRNMMLFRGASEDDRQKLNQMIIQQNGIIIPGLEFEQMELKGDIEGAASVFDLATRVRHMNNRKFPINERVRGGEAITAAQYLGDTAKEAQFTDLQIAFYRSTGLDCQLSEMYRRLAQPAENYPEKWPGGKVAKEFREKCKEFGIPEADLLKVKTVRANRNGGTGNMGIDLMKGKEILAVATPGQGQLNARKEIVATLKGAHMVPAFVEEPQPLANEIDRVIDHENLFIQDGKTPTALGSDPHDKHLERHIALLGELQAVVGQFMEMGITPDNLDDAMALHSKLDAGIEHSQQHVAFLSEMPRTNGRAALFEQLVKETTKTLNSLQQMSIGFAKDIERAAAEQQQSQQQTSPELLKAAAQAQALLMKTQAEIAAKQAASEAKLGNLALTTQARTEMKMAEHEQALGLKAQEAVVAQEQERAKGQEQRTTEALKTAQELQQNSLSHQQEMLQKAQEIAMEQEKKANEPKKEEGK